MKKLIPYLLFFHFAFCTHKEKGGGVSVEKNNTNRTQAQPPSFTLLTKKKINNFKIRNHLIVEPETNNKYLEEDAHFLQDALSKLAPDAEDCNFNVHLNEVNLINEPVKDTIKIFRYKIIFSDTACAKSNFWFSGKPMIRKLITYEKYPITCYYFPCGKDIVLLSHYGLQEYHKNLNTLQLHHFLNNVFSSEK